MRTLFHITTIAAWEEALQTGDYRVPSLASEGFIHFSRPHQVQKVANARFRGTRGLCLLQIGEEALLPELKYENSDGDVFPHLYGPLNLSAVLGVFDFAEANDGFHLPTPFHLIGQTLVRPGIAGDEGEITSTHTHAWQQSYLGLLPDEILSKRPLSFRTRAVWWRNVLAQKTTTQVTVAESRDHGIVGFCACAPARDESLAGKGEISAIYCLNEYKRQGLGRALFRAACERLRRESFTHVYLWTLKNNPSVGFYRKMGGVQLALEKTIDLGGPQVEIAFEWALKDITT